MCMYIKISYDIKSRILDKSMDSIEFTCYVIKNYRFKCFEVPSRHMIINDYIPIM